MKDLSTPGDNLCIRLLGSCALDEEKTTVRQLADALAEAIAERNVAQARVELLIDHIDGMCHTIHRAYHPGGHPGYFYCSMPYCARSAELVKQDD